MRRNELTSVPALVSSREVEGLMHVSHEVDQEAEGDVSTTP